MKSLSQDHQGYLFAFGAILLFSFYPIANLWGFGAESIFLLLSGSGGFAALFFALQITFQRKWKEVLGFRDWKNFFGMFIFINVLFYGLYLYGNLITTAGATSIMAMSQILFSFLILGFLKYEKFTPRAIFGSILMMLGAGLILWKKGMGIDLGALIVFFSFLFTPIGNIFQKRMRGKVSSATFLFWRNIGVFLFFGLCFFIVDKPDFVSQFSLESWLVYLALYGFFFWFLEKTFWTEVLHRMPITKASVLTILVPPLTLIFAYLILNEMPTSQQIFGFIPIAIGAYMVLMKNGFVTLKR